MLIIVQTLHQLLLIVIINDDPLLRSIDAIAKSFILELNQKVIVSS